MTWPYADEIAANLERAGQSVQAARQLAAGGYYDFAAWRAYYAAFYASTAILLSEGAEEFLSAIKFLLQSRGGLTRG